ncbi:hypothetical protein D3C74_387030 [compost metagenome]
MRFLSSAVPIQPVALPRLEGLATYTLQQLATGEREHVIPVDIYNRFGAADRIAVSKKHTEAINSP